MGNGIKFSINVDRLFRYHLTAIGIFALADLVTVAASEFFGFGTMKGLTPLFSLEGEGNLPTLFSSAALFLLAAVCLFCVSTAGEGERIFWKTLAAVFLFLAVDEAVSIHEYLSVIVQKLLHAGGAFSRAWVIPYGAAAAIFAILTFRNLRALPPSTRYGLVVAGSLYVVGAIGFEMLESVLIPHVGTISVTLNLTYALCVLCEEVMEMLGIALALRTCLLHFMGQARLMNLTVAAAAERSHPASAGTLLGRTPDFKARAEAR